MERAQSPVGGKIRIAVYCAHPLLLDGMVSAFRGSDLIDVVAAATTVRQTMSAIQASRPGIILVDLDSAEGGLAPIRSFTSYSAEMKVIVLTASEQQERVTEVLQAGASGYVLKSVNAAKLVKVAVDVNAGRSYVSPSLAANLLLRSNRETPTVRASASLTPREDEILAFVSRGLTNKEVANSLQLSEKTVKHYMTNILQKLQVRNRMEAALLARNQPAMGGLRLLLPQ